MENHIYKQSKIMFLGVHGVFFILCFFVLAISLSINFFLFLVILVLCFVLFGHLLSKQKTIVVEKEDLLIKTPSYSKRILWENIASMASPSYLIFGYVIQLKSGERYTLPYFQNWKDFEKDIEEHTDLNKTAEGWYPGMGGPKSKRWTKPGEKQMSVGIYDGWLYFRPEQLLSKESLKYILIMVLFSIPWILLVLIIQSYS